MALRIENNVINTAYYKQNKKDVVSETSFENQLNDSKKKSSAINNQDTVNLGLLNNTGGYRVSNNYSSDKIEKRREEIQKIQNHYIETTKELGPEGEGNWGKMLNPKIMEDVLNLNIENNKDIYFTNGKININKVAENCGISLNNATPLELQSLRKEIYDEGLMSEKEADALEFFISRTYSDIAHENGCSEEYAYKNVRFNVSDRANYYKKEDIEYNIDQAIRNLDDIVLDLIKN